MPVMITNGNNVHSPDYHAEITAGKIIGAAENAVVSIATSANLGVIHAGRDLRKKIEAIVLEHHQKVHDLEQAEISEKGVEHCDCEPTSHGEVDDEVLDRILAAAEGTPFATVFQMDIVREGILAELHHETRSQKKVHRLVHRRSDEIARRPRAVT